MPAYRFEATGRDGQRKHGIIQAESLQDAEGRVLGRGWKILSVQEAKLNKPREAPPPPASKKKTAIVLLILVLLLAGAVFVYLDPYGQFPFIPR